MASQIPWHQVSMSAAELYEQVLAPAMFAPWAPKLIDVARVKPGVRILDVACGTGVAARVAATRAGNPGRVVGLGFSPPMLAVARSLSPVDGSAIDWVEANALKMPLPGEAFDVVLCQHG